MSAAAGFIERFAEGGFPKIRQTLKAVIHPIASLKQRAKLAAPIAMKLRHRPETRAVIEAIKRAHVQAVAEAEQELIANGLCDTAQIADYKTRYMAQRNEFWRSRRKPKVSAARKVIRELWRLLRKVVLYPLPAALPYWIFSGLALGLAARLSPPRAPSASLWRRPVRQDYAAAGLSAGGQGAARTRLPDLPHP